MLELVPIEFDEACAFVKKYHRHHRPPQGYKFCVAVAKDEIIVGVVIAGRPNNRHLDDGWRIDVIRLATDGTKNACSMLYGAARRAAKAMGYKKMGTYILETEPGTSLYAAGFEFKYLTKGGTWNCKSRPRVDKHPTQRKIRFEAVL